MRVGVIGQLDSDSFAENVSEALHDMGHLVTRLGPADLHGYAFWIRVYTGAQVFVRDANGLQLTSSPVPDVGPPVLPESGVVSYQDTSWLVYSFPVAAGALLYMLIAAS